MHTDRCGNTCGQKCCAKESTKYKSLCTDTTNVEHEVYDYTSNNWNQRNGNKRFKEKPRTHTRKTFNRYTTKDLEHHI